MDESISQVFVNELLQCFLFELGQGVDGSYQRLRIFFQIDSEVVRMVGSECFCFGLAKDVGVLVVFFRNSREVDFLGDGGGFGLYCGTELEGECFRA